MYADEQSVADITKTSEIVLTSQPAPEIVDFGEEINEKVSVCKLMGCDSLLLKYDVY